MSGQSLYRAIVSGQAGVWSLPIRGLLRAAEPLYRVGIAARNRHYDRHGPQVRPPVPVISVGNLTVGGTGKTPFVIHVVQRLEAFGLSPTVVARGYHAANGAANDEERLIRTRCPSVGYVADPDRAQAAHMAHRVLGADVIVLDDGFQHRRLARDLEIVLVDSTCPFGFGHLLPRGLLREPISSLRRADVIVMTRCDQVAPADLPRLEGRLRAANPNATLLECIHRVDGIVRLDGRPIEDGLDRQRAVLFAGIANPEAFAATASALGVEIVGTRWWPDHHRYTRRDVDRLAATSRFAPHDWLLTTEKDGVKLAALEGLDHLPIGVVRVTIGFRGGTPNPLDDLLRRAVAKDETG